MTDAFASYGATAAPARAPKVPRLKPESALDKRMAERDRLTRHYRVLKRQERIAILAHEPRLLAFMRYLMKVGPDDGDELLEAIGESWLMQAPADVRGFALSLIARRTDKIRLMLGLDTMSDPLPPDTSVFLQARTLLRQAGPL